MQLKPLYSAEKNWDDGQYIFTEIGQQHGENSGVSVGKVEGHLTCQMYVRYHGERDIIVLLSKQEFASLHYLMAGLLWYDSKDDIDVPLYPENEPAGDQSRDHSVSQ